jgi:nucleoside-diphosphate-sugar epimerase
MKISVTGANSFLGAAICSGLISKGHEVFALINKNTDRIKSLISNDNFEYTDSINDLEKVKDAYAIYHFAWFGTNRTERADKKIQAESIDMSKRIFDIALENNISKFIFAGSQAEIGLRSEYGRAKAEFASYAKDFLKNNTCNMEFYHLQIFSVFGRGDHKGTLIDLVVSAAKENKEIELSSASQKWNFICIDDAVYLMEIFLDDEKLKNIPKQDAYHIGSSDTRPLKDYILEIAKVNKGYDKEKLLFGKRESNIEGSYDLIPDVSWIGDYKFKNFLDEVKRL